MHDSEILEGLAHNDSRRAPAEKELYMQYNYFIEEGMRKYSITYDDSFSAYSDAVLSAIHNIVQNRFHGAASLKTYLYQIFSNKCIDAIRKNTTRRQAVNQSAAEPELLGHLPDSARTIIEKLIDQQKILAVKKYLETIGEKCKAILLLFEDGYSDKEIAHRLAYNNASVAKTTRLRCLEKIRENMKSAFVRHGA